MSSSLQDSLVTITFPEGQIALSSSGEWSSLQEGDSLLDLKATLATAMTFPYLPFSPWQGRPGMLAALAVVKEIGGKIEESEVVEMPAGTIY